jgi:DUF1680 family protein
MYLTGGIGSAEANEGFTRPYDLPNRTAYAETCASIGLIFWAHRMLQLDLNSQYGDVLERVLYNSFLSSVSLEGGRFFYTNPLYSDGSHHRQSVFNCFCCPPNVIRFLSTLGSFIYSQKDREIDVHLYVQSRATVDLDGSQIIIEQETDYPWDGIICIRLKMAKAQSFILRLRKPGWCEEVRLYLNDSDIPIGIDSESGYLTLEREWQPNDELRLQLLMPVHRVYAHPEIDADVGRVALIRGPLVYCLESVDQSEPELNHLRLRRESAFDCEFEPDLLGGVVTINGAGAWVDMEEWNAVLYRKQPPALKNMPFKAIPYYAWDNRTPGEMTVWIPEVG